MGGFSACSGKRLSFADVDGVLFSTGIVSPTIGAQAGHFRCNRGRDAGYDESTNFYEVDHVEALTTSGDNDPSKTFRYCSLFFCSDAFRPIPTGGAAGSMASFREAGSTPSVWAEWLKDRTFLTIFPHLAQGFLVGRKQRLGQNREPTEEGLADIFEPTLTLLYRLLFLLYTESHDLPPIREAPYHAASLKKIKEAIAEKAVAVASGVADRLQTVYSPKETTLYDRLCQLFSAMDKGDPILNVPTYNGGLCNTSPDKSERRDQRLIPCAANGWKA
jgi:hypothetical protein